MLGRRRAGQTLALLAVLGGRAAAEAVASELELELDLPKLAERNEAIGSEPDDAEAYIIS